MKTPLLLARGKVTCLGVRKERYRERKCQSSSLDARKIAAAESTGLFGRIFYQSIAMPLVNG